MLFFSRWKILFVIFICVSSIILASVNFFPKDSKVSNIIPANAVSLGLDLRGGSHLLLQIDFDFYLHEKLTNLKNDIKKSLRKERIRTIPTLHKNIIHVKLYNKNQVKQAKKNYYKN